MVHRFSVWVANWLGRQIDAPKRAPVLAYGLETILNTVIQFLLILLVAWLFDLLFPVLLVMISFAFLRAYAGGKHLNTFLWCTVFDIVLINLIALIAVTLTRWLAPSALASLLFVCLFFSFLFLRKYAPVMNPERPGSRHPERYRRKSLWLLVCFGILTGFVFPFSPLAAVSLTLGLFAESLSVTPVGCRAVDLLDQPLSHTAIKS